MRSSRGMGAINPKKLKSIKKKQNGGKSKSPSAAKIVRTNWATKR